MDYMLVLTIIIQLLIVAGIFAILTYLSKFIANKIQSNEELKHSKFFNLVEYFPSEKISSLKQLFYLIMIFAFIVIALYLIFGWTASSIPIFILDIIISIYLAINVKINSAKDKIILILLIPFGSIAKIAFGDYSTVLYDILHIIGYVYFIGVYYRKFVKFTENNGLGISIMLLYTILLVSFLFTMIVEDVSPLDSITMVTNAFTSNSFDAAGKSVVGKLDSLIIAWGGFLLSSVGTATLAVSIVQQYVDRQFDEMEELIKNKKKEK